MQSISRRGIYAVFAAHSAGVGGVRRQARGYRPYMTLGPRILFIGLAAVLFVLAVFMDDNYFDLLALGLAALAVGLVIDEVGLGRFSTRR
jgi:hypothetical protein